MPGGRNAGQVAKKQGVKLNKRMARRTTGEQTRRNNLAASLKSIRSGKGGGESYAGYTGPGARRLYSAAKAQPGRARAMRKEKRAKLAKRAAKSGGKLVKTG